MRFLFRCLLVLFLLTVVAAGASYFLPREARVERSVVVQADAAEVQEWVDDLSRWSEWTVWMDDPEMKVEFSGPARGEGARMDWDSESQGSGSLTITKCRPGEGVWYEMVMNEGDPLLKEDVRSRAAITFKAREDGLEVRWTHWNEFDQKLPYLRYVGLFADRLMGPDFEDCLSNLEKKVEGAGPGTAP